MAKSTSASKGTSGQADEGRARLRKAGRLEQWYNSRSRLDLVSYVVVTATYGHVDGQPLSRKILFTALEKIVRENASLACRLPPTSAPPYYIRLPAVDLNRVVKFIDKDSEELEALLEETYARPMEFLEDMPLWRLLVLTDGTLVLTYDHAMGDGQSGLAFHHLLLAALQDIPSDITDHSGIITSLPQDASLAPTMEETIDVSVPFRIIARELIKLVVPLSLHKDGKGWTGNPVPKTATLEMSLRILQYSPKETSRLVRIAREHNTTLTCTIHTLALVILSDLIHARPGNTKKYKTIPTNIPISLRRLSGAPPTAFCNHISMYFAHHPLFRPNTASAAPDAFPWTVAAELSAKLKREVPRSPGEVGVLKFFFGDYDGYHRGLLGKKREGGFELSNLGRFPDAPAVRDSVSDEGKDSGAGAGGWRIREMLFAQADVTVGSPIKVNVVGTPAGGLGVTVTWGKSAVEHEMAEEFVKALDEGLRGLIAPQKV